LTVAGLPVPTDLQGMGNCLPVAADLERREAPVLGIGVLTDAGAGLRLISTVAKEWKEICVGATLHSSLQDNIIVPTTMVTTNNLFKY
jgi:hypothetical protein